ncbi:hypothetical protein BDN67DRAFT_985681 [Paxillus ammoniavirescens]|nr:hypothetical protein BDN67DRAFT_985681 [Paxillus ammoniavirescens]
MWHGALKKKQLVQQLLEMQKLIKDVEQEASQYLTRDTITLYHCWYYDVEIKDNPDWTFISTISAIRLDKKKGLCTHIKSSKSCHGPASGDDSDAPSVQVHDLHSEDSQSITVDHVGSVVGTNANLTEVLSKVAQDEGHQAQSNQEIAQADDSLPLSLRRTCRLNRQLPQQFRDMLPESFLSLPPPEVLQVITHTPPIPPTPPPIPSVPPTCPELLAQQECAQPQVRHTFRTQLNSFDWYWNQGTMKSRQDFRSLLNIVGNLDFKPDDICNTKWTVVDHELGNIVAPDNSCSQTVPSANPSGSTATLPHAEWMNNDAGWRNRVVTISVPFPSWILWPTTAFIMNRLNCIGTHHIKPETLEYMMQSYGHSMYFLEITPSTREASHLPICATMLHIFKLELFHAQWTEILGDKFVHAYEHGIVMKCVDGIKWCIFPQIFMYSTNYPEKVLIANIRNLGACPCPRCTIPKDRIQNLAMERDMLQRRILARKDTKERRNKISAACRLIYEQPSCLPASLLWAQNATHLVMPSRRLDFLWVQWFEPLKSPAATGWERSILDKARFIPMDSTNTFGFVDPADVLRCCHLMPAFADGRLHPDHITMSQLASNADDWKYYYVNGFMDHDMLMCYHWGLGIGHLYAHTKRPSEINPYNHSVGQHDDLTTVLDDDGLGLLYTKASDEMMQPDGEDGNDVPNVDLPPDSGSEDSNCLDCLDNLIAAMYESDQENSDLEDYEF